MIKRIDPQDYSFRQFKAYKLWNLNQDSSGILVYEGTQMTSSVFYSGSEVYSNNVPKRLIFDHINHLYYTGNTALTIYGQAGVYEDNIRIIHSYCNVISVPGRYFGEQIKPQSVTIVDSATGLTYTDDANGNLIDSASVVVGNVIYPHGMIIATHSASMYTASFTEDFTLAFRATTTIFENEIFVSIPPDAFNVSQNPTAYITDTSSMYHGFIRKSGIADIPGQGEFYYNLNYTSSVDTTRSSGFGDYAFSASIDPTGSYLAPYITAIGFYDDDMNCIAVAKLTNAIKSLPDIPVNFIIRIDT